MLYLISKGLDPKMSFKISSRVLVVPNLQNLFLHSLQPRAAELRVKGLCPDGFVSIEEFSMCCNKLSKTHIDQLKKLGTWPR